MSAKLIWSCKSFGTVGPCAYMGLFPSVGTHVGFEMVTSGEPSFADLTLEWPDSCVLSGVSSQLVWPWKSLSTSFMVTNIWFLTSVLPDVHLQMWQFHVPLGAAWVQANKWLATFLFAIGRAHWLHLGYNEGWVSRHSHLYGGGSLILVGISRNTSIGKVFDRVCLGIWRHRWDMLYSRYHVVLRREGKNTSITSWGQWQTVIICRGQGRQWLIWQVGQWWKTSFTDRRKVGLTHEYFRYRRVLVIRSKVLLRSCRWRVAKFTITHWWTGISSWVGWRWQLLVLQRDGSVDAKEFWTNIIHSWSWDITVRWNCKINRDTCNVVIDDSQKNSYP